MDSHISQLTVIQAFASAKLQSARSLPSTPSQDCEEKELKGTLLEVHGISGSTQYDCKQNLVERQEKCSEIEGPLTQSQEFGYFNAVETWTELKVNPVEEQGISIESETPLAATHSQESEFLNFCTEFKVNSVVGQGIKYESVASAQSQEGGIESFNICHELKENPENAQICSGYFNTINIWNELKVNPVEDQGRAETVPPLASAQSEEILKETKLKPGLGRGRTRSSSAGSPQFQLNVNRNLFQRRGRTEGTSNSITSQFHELRLENSHWNEPVKGRGRLFSTKSGNKLEILKKWDLNNCANNNISENNKLNTKNIICNAVPFISNPIFKYTITFNPEIISETRRIGFLTKHFFKLNKKFIYNKFSVFVPNLLQNHELTGNLTNSSTLDKFTMELNLEQMLNLETHPKLLSRLFEEIIEAPESKIIHDYGIKIREGQNGMLLLCLDYGCYCTEENTVSDMVLELKNRYHERYNDALNILLKNTSIFFNNKIYTMDRINWEKPSLELERNNFQITAKFEDCKLAEKITSRPQTPKDFISNLKKLFSSDLWKEHWKIEFGDFTKAKARVLQPQTIIFADGVEYTPTDGNWEQKMRENEVYIATELWSWMILYTPSDSNRAKRFSENIQKLSDDTGISIGKPLLFQIDSDTKQGYVTALNDLICKELQLIVVIIPKSPNKPKALIKHICCVINPIPYHLIHASNLDDPLIIHEIALQLNLINGGIPWTIKIPYRNWMVCGIDLNSDVCSFVTALGNDATQWYSKAIIMEHNFLKSLQEWLDDTLNKFKDTSGRFPDQILIYQNCSTKETRGKFYEDYSKLFCMKNINICVILVEKQTNVCVYKDLKSGVDNVPPGTIVDNTITNPNAHDFFLTSVTNHCTYYEVIKNTSDISSEQLELVTYKMCHLFYKHAKTVEVPAPCLYAEKLGNLVSKDIHGIPSADLDECLHYL